VPRMPAARGYSAGFATVAPAPTPRIVQGPSVSRAVEGLGEAVRGIGADMIQTEQRRTGELQDAAAREARQQDAEQEQERRRTGRLKAANAALDLELSVADTRKDLDDKLATGELKAEEYEGRLQASINERQGQLRQALPAETHIDFDMAAQRASRQAQLGGKQALKAHAKREAVAELDKGREGMLRVAVTDLPRALAMADAMYAREGPYAKQIGIDQAQKQGQSVRELATRAHFQQRVANSQNDGRALAALRQEISANGTLDPGQQTALLTAIDGRTTVLDTKARIAIERHERKQDQAFKALQELDAQGLPLDAKFLAQTMATLKGSPLADAAAAMIKGSADTAGFGSRPVKEQDQIIMAEFAKARDSGVDPNSSKRLQRLVGIRNSTEAAVRQDPWRAANERGAIDQVPPIRLDSIEGMGASLGERMAMAPTVDVMAGRVVSPLRPDEASALAETIQALPVPERSKMLGALHQAVGPQRMQAIAEQIKAKDGVLGIAAAYQASGLQAPGGVNLGEMVLKGAEAVRTKTVKVDDAAGLAILQDVRKQIEGVYATPSATDAAAEAAMMMWAGAAADGRRLSAKEVVKLATGGVTEHNGQKLPMPYGWDERRTTRSIAAITPAHIQAQAGGNAPLWIGSQQILPEDVARMVPQAQLRSAGPDRYAIRIGDRLVTTDGRKPFTIALPAVQ